MTENVLMTRVHIFNKKKKNTLNKINNHTKSESYTNIVVHKTI